jgi:hypothetical protein
MLAHDYILEMGHEVELSFREEMDLPQQLIDNHVDQSSVEQEQQFIQSAGIHSDSEGKCFLAWLVFADCLVFLISW